ncbi:DUF2784 domain-containing protein [Thermodesulfobacteriota bacterium]
MSNKTSNFSWRFYGTSPGAKRQSKKMYYSFFSDIVVLLHFIYVIFAVTGGILLIWWRKMIWLHLPAAIWAALISFTGWICPLTYLENWLRLQGGKTGCSGGFVIKYIEPVLYPAGLTYFHQMVIGIIVVVLNMAIYGYILVPVGWLLSKRNRISGAHLGS